MPAKGKVSIPIQTLFCLIPVFDMVAAYRVKKLRKYMLIFLLVTAPPAIIAENLLFPEVETVDMDGFLQFMTFYYGVDDSHFAFSIIVWIASVLFAMYLVRYWSKKWNLQFDAMN